jgi:cytochrome c2
MTFLRVTAFSLVVVLSYTLFANILPQVQSDPPQEEAVDTASLDLAGQIAWGERLFDGKGTCTLCHNNLGRAPDLLAMDLAAAFDERLVDPRYDGEAKGADGAQALEVYLRESLIAPSAYVVAGFGKKGTNDTVSPMPKVDGAPISLGEDEMNALIAFLQDKAGLEVTAPLPSGGAEVAVTAIETTDPVETAGPATDPETIIENLGCAGCHDIMGSEADVGPRLDGLGRRMDRGAIRQAILDPNAEIAEGFEPDFMPADYGEQMWVSELELLIDYLASLPAAEAGQ